MSGPTESWSYLRVAERRAPRACLGRDGRPPGCRGRTGAAGAGPSPGARTAREATPSASLATDQAIGSGSGARGAAPAWLILAPPETSEAAPAPTGNAVRASREWPARPRARPRP